MMMLVLGATGLLGQAVVAEGRQRGLRVRTAARRDAEIALDVSHREALEAVLQREQPQLIVNCAALVDLAKCESDPGLAYRINAAPAAQLARWCAAAGAKLVQVSTDHFFTGEGAAAHGEDAPVTLLNEYAATKYAGERFALLSPDALVLRTSIVGIRGWAQPSFAEWAITAIREDRPMTLFSDAFTSSIDVASFARAALDLVGQNASGLLNLAAREVYSKQHFIQQLAAELNAFLTNAAVGSVGTLSPPRPQSLGLDVSRAQALLDWPLPDLQQVAGAVVAAYRSE